MLLHKAKSCLLIVDVQEKLTPLVLNSQQLVMQCEWLMRLANELDVPILVTEHYSKGLGQTVAALAKHMPSQTEIDKVHFSCFRDDFFIRQWQTINKQQVVIAGIETHVCVLQTAMDMKKEGYEVFVVVNAVSSRHDADHQYGLQRMAQAGIHLVTTEMIFFEWVECAGTLTFKTLSQAFLRDKKG